MTDFNAARPPFYWGVSTSGYQSEGGYNQPGQPQNNWSQAERSGQVAVTGKAAEFWQRYAKDFATCQHLGVTAFRMSLEWARIQPASDPQIRTAPAFDFQAMDDYALRIAACQKAGLEPIVTLQHFTHPLWLGVDAWLKEETLGAYLTYVETAVSHINHRLVTIHQTRPIRWFLTINEPNILVINTYLNGTFPSDQGISLNRAMVAFDHLLAAHIQAYDRIHQIYATQGWDSPMVSLNTYCSDLYWSEKLVWDLLNLASQPVPAQQLPHYFRHRAESFETALRQFNLPFRRDLPYRVGRLFRQIVHWMGERYLGPQSFQTTLRAVANCQGDRLFDYLALDYYDPFLAHSVRLPSFADLESDVPDFRGWVMSSMQTKWWDWRSLPEGLYCFCRYYSQEYSGTPILIAENGMALRRTEDNKTATTRRDQLRRSQFLREHLAQVQRLKTAGIPLVGYCHWSFTDNYEWGSFTPRFGLFSLDFERGCDRREADHLGDRPAQTYAQLIAQYSPAPSLPQP
ncbi:family 1 glycosylhydrolase [Lyngbya confervoides]|uniref:Family 1 glycosylhydrolase n=1 Tax=Lyngbya confervoides BDU141951 TaxID=1574623 RepID=A0ABD4SZY6_9CYAN|nr:family 1 glycosylhydrolase [Lyngbya confervoides]MCM1981700.1 family 1 glycosylhydrolase [Lyngbya confervoides BDU141951]